MAVALALLIVISAREGLRQGYFDTMRECHRVVRIAGDFDRAHFGLQIARKLLGTVKFDLNGYEWCHEGVALLVHPDGDEVFIGDEVGHIPKWINTNGLAVLAQLVPKGFRVSVWATEARAAASFVAFGHRGTSHEGWHLRQSIHQSRGF